MMMLVPVGIRYPVALCYGVLVDFELSSADLEGMEASLMGVALWN